jgi:hypothetical protein
VSNGDGSLRVALLAHTFADEPEAPASLAARMLAGGLRETGHRPTVITCHAGPSGTESIEGIRVARVRRLPEAALRFRGFVTPLTQLPFTLAALERERFDVAHAFTEVDAWASVRWRERGGGDAIFTCAEPPTRETLADRRQRLKLVTRAFWDSDAVAAASSEVRDEVERWLSLDVPIVAPGDAAGYVELYVGSA